MSNIIIQRFHSFILLFFLMLLPMGGIMAQDSSSSDEDEDPCVDLKDDRMSWTIDPLTGIVHPQAPDTSYLRMGDRQTMEGLALSLSYTGNLYSPHQIDDYFRRRNDHDFLFLNVYSLFAHRPEDVLFRSTKVPYTVVGYTTSGSNLQSNDRLRIDFAGNVNKKVGIGTFLDYVYARGDYMSSATKPLKWTSYLYYKDERYKAYLTYNLSKLANQENGGIQDRSYVLRPDAFDDNFTDPKTMPTNLNKTWNDMDSWNLHLTHSYDLGNWGDYYPNPEDTTVVDERFTSVASIFHSVDYESYKHMFRMDAGADMSSQRNYYKNHFLRTDNLTQDSITYSCFSTYAGLRINEGFSSWSQFGLAAFIGYERQQYDMMQDSDTLDANFKPYIPDSHVSNNVFVGGQLSRHQSSLLTFDVTGKLGLMGDKAGDIDITGDVQTVIPFGKEKKDSLIVHGSGYFRNLTPSYMLDHYLGNHFRWTNEFDQEQRLRLQGEITYPRTGTTLRAGIEHINNYHFFAIDSLNKYVETDFCPRQYGDQLDIFSLELNQDLHWRALHWNNSILFQQTTDDKVLALPTLSVRSDLNLRFVIAKTLSTELGAIVHYRTKYYAPTYQPATQQFAQQHEIKCGGYPTVNAYVNCNLKRLKFYIMYSGAATQAFTNDAFIMPFYPAAPTRLEYGVIFDLQN